MNISPRERFWRFVNFQPIDHLPFWADWLGPWHRWRAEGLPVGPVIDDERLKAWSLEYFGFEGMYSAFWGQPRVPVNIGPYPTFEPEIYEETDSYTLFRSGNGVIVRQFKFQEESIHSTQFVEYPIKSRRDWEQYRDERLKPDEPRRYPESQEWEKLKKAWAARDGVISIDGGSFYGFLRDWIGFKTLSYWLIDDPELVHDMMDSLADFYIQVLEKAVSEVDIDFAMFWEDMCYKTGPLLSPKMFRKFMLPCYQKVTDFLVKNNVHLSWVDCDGNIEALLPLWLEGGVHGFYPLEVASGMDAVRLRKQYGQQIIIWGNVDKRALIQGEHSIDVELARLSEVIPQGGFIPLVDHSVPDDVSLSHYLYYLEQRKKLSGMS
jgi:hypothetical protein